MLTHSKEVHVQSFPVALECFLGPFASYDKTLLPSQVLDEIGVDVHSKMATAPRTRVAQQQQHADTEKEDAEADDLLARLSALK